MAASAVALLVIAGIGGAAMYNSIEPMAHERVQRKTSRVRPMGYDELANQVVDPRNIISNPKNTNVTRLEQGPYGVPRSVLDVRGDYEVPAFGQPPGIHVNI